MKLHGFNWSKNDKSLTDDNIKRFQLFMALKFKLIEVKRI